MQRVSATDVKRHLAGTRCDRRVWINKTGAAVSRAPTNFELALQELGVEHERLYAESTFPDRLDLGAVDPLAARFQATLEAIEGADRVIYQGALITTFEVDGAEVEAVGQPDFIVPMDGGFTIQDAKFARRISESDGPEIIKQLQMYGWLFEQVTGTAPIGLEVYTAKGELVPIDRDDCAVLAELSEIYRLSRLPAEPFEVVGWSKCKSCEYEEHCWDRAVHAHEPGTIPGVDVGLGEQLHLMGIERYEEIAERFDPERLAELERPQGPRRKMERVGVSRTTDIFNSVQAHLAERPLVLAKPEIPECDHYVMFDLEGVPPRRDSSQRVYLWGMQAYPADGSGPDEARFPLAGFESEGDRDGWESFLDVAESLMELYGEDVPFVHWANYEKTLLGEYIKTYGDPKDIAKKILEENLLDLLDVTKASVALPLPSYSLKVIEEYLGYERESGLSGDKSIALYLEAEAAKNNPSVRAELMDELKRYNGEDLYATWVVMEWLRGLTTDGFAPPPDDFQLPQWSTSQ